MRAKKQFEGQLLAIVREIRTITRYNESIAKSVTGMAHWLVKICVMEVVCVPVGTGLC
jgi:hypothetical protein